MKNELCICRTARKLAQVDQVAMSSLAIIVSQPLASFPGQSTFSVCGTKYEKLELVVVYPDVLAERCTV